jgi:hypothetical protein
MLGFLLERTHFPSMFRRLLPFVDRVFDPEGGKSDTRYIPKVVLHTLLMCFLQTDLTFAQLPVALFTFLETVDDVVAGVDGCKGCETRGHEFESAKLFTSTLFFGAGAQVRITGARRTHLSLRMLLGKGTVASIVRRGTESTYFSRIFGVSITGMAVSVTRTVTIIRVLIIRRAVIPR